MAVPPNQYLGLKIYLVMIDCPQKLICQTDAASRRDMTKWPKHIFLPLNLRSQKAWHTFLISFSCAFGLTPSRSYNLVSATLDIFTNCLLCVSLYFHWRILTVCFFSPALAANDFWKELQGKQQPLYHTVNLNITGAFACSRMFQ